VRNKKIDKKLSSPDKKAMKGILRSAAGFGIYPKRLLSI